jgi:hypothetical protein
MVVVLVETMNACTPNAQAVWEDFVVDTLAFIHKIVADQFVGSKRGAKWSAISKKLLLQ